MEDDKSIFFKKRFPQCLVQKNRKNPEIEKLIPAKY